MARSPHAFVVGGAVLAVALAGCAPATPAPSGPATPVPSATAATAPNAVRIKGTVRTDGRTPLSLRKRPTTTSARLARIPHGSAITILCKTSGDSVNNSGKRSTVWDKVTWKGETGYVSAVFVDTGESAALSTCASEAEKPKPSSTPSTRPAGVENKIIEIARSQRGVRERKNNCNPYGGCMAWCSLFATWAWNKAGDPIPRFPFTGDLYTWGQKHKRSHPGTEGVGPGDLVLYGTGPKTVKSSVHVDIVIEVFPDKLRVIGGNVKDKVTERTVPRTGIYGWVDA